MDIMLELAEGLPSGLYTGGGIESYLHRVLEEPGRSDDFTRARLRAVPDRDRPRHGERVVFGADGLDDVPISTAVRASGALPMVYTPVRVGGARADRRWHAVDDQPRHRRARRGPS